ncbi:MAG: stage 0 sporulation protein [Oscillospiraceae bacterium]|jgi:cell fate regulator YaaT (PSP1 superfamily)|nr:stage 0 sporulation protein [Oscillospiraceae bacterium]
MEEKVTIVGVRFDGAGRVYSFNPQGAQYAPGDDVIVESEHNIDIAKIISGNHEVDKSTLLKPLKSVIRKANAADLETMARYTQREKDAFTIFVEKVAEHNLPMEPVKTRSTFDGKKMVFYFLAENRVDFRELVKDMAQQFRFRVELLQINARSEAQMFGGMGLCGRAFCCSSYLSEFPKITLKLAKGQSLSLNSEKISGACGRLMCCLSYEEDAYRHLRRVTPAVGEFVKTAQGRGTVAESNMMSGMLKVALERNPAAPQPFHRREVERMNPRRTEAEG